MSRSKILKLEDLKVVFVWRVSLFTGEFIIYVFPRETLLLAFIDR